MSATGRRVDAVTARALRLALAPDVTVDDAAAQLLALAGGSWALLNAVLIRLDRSLSLRWCEVTVRASDAVRLALAGAAKPVRAA